MPALERYRQKRDFAVTPEPKGQVRRAAGKGYLIQKHAARRLHYDLRLELDGVLKSWAVTRGPSLVPGDKRLAVEVEDHPLEYGTFEGTIPKGAYGGGTVALWDRGTWSPLGDARKGLSKGHLEFALKGEKLRGRWHLVRLKGKPGEKRRNWLLIKGEDEEARGAKDPDILKEQPNSVKSGRSLEEIAEARPARRSRQTAQSPLPDFVPPMLATLVGKPPAGSHWLHEIKFDGYRLQARIGTGKARLLTRGGLDWTRRFGKPLLEALRDLPVKQALIDGEAVVESTAGASDFPALQAALSAGRKDGFLFYAFDLLHLDGEDLRALPLHERKARLAALLRDARDPLRYSEHYAQSGALVLQHACRLSLEGVVSKRRDAPYVSGRSRDWQKSKCATRQEFVIGGFTLSSTGKRMIGSLALGVHEDGKLRHVGRVGTGFSEAAARDLYRRLSPLRVERSPFAGRLTALATRDLQFVKPVLVAEVEFRGWTADANLRHAAFRGLREDKPAGEVQREMPAGTASDGTAARRAIALTNPDRVYWPDEGITKAGLADYYAAVWRFIAPHVVGRPLALLRCPTGIGGQRFFQKHGWKGMNAAIQRLVDPKDRTAEPMIGIEDLKGLLALAQSAALEIHPWGSTASDWERPDRIVMDLDPGEGVPWDQIAAAAEETRARLAGAGLTPFLKTSGGKGLHVVAPLKPDADWPAVKAFTKGLAQAMASDSPQRFVATIAKAKRRGRILVDYLRNQRGATAVAPYSTRARPGAPVSMPLAWSELKDLSGPDAFTLASTPGRLAGLKSDPWGDFHKAAARLRG